MRSLMNSVVATGLFVALVSTFTSSASADEVNTRAQNQIETQDQNRIRTQSESQYVYGWQLMTPGERQAYQQRMRNAKTEEEREEIRLQHHKEMQKRAEERGAQLPDEPRRAGSGGMGQGQGMGQGMGGQFRRNRP